MPKTIKIRINKDETPDLGLRLHRSLCYYLTVPRFSKREVCGAIIWEARIFDAGAYFPAFQFRSAIDTMLSIQVFRQSYLPTHHFQQVHCHLHKMVLVKVTLKKVAVWRRIVVRRRSKFLWIMLAPIWIEYTVPNRLISLTNA